ncbi:MAG: hypothetical protein PT957_00595 [Firmicutes bacterium]|nr:hypothetical protein [Bacillota bacterium]
MAKQNALPLLIPLQKDMRKSFIDQIQDHDLVEILSLPLPSYMKKKDAQVCLDYLHCQLTYTRDDIIAHMREVLQFLELYPNYSVYLDYHVNLRLRIQVKEQGQALVIRTKAPAVIFDIRHMALSTAIWQELEQIEYSIPISSREDVKSRIRDDIRALS